MTFIKPERHFSTFSKNNTQPPSIVFLIKSYNFHEKSWVFFSKIEKSGWFRENRKPTTFLFWEIKQIHGFRTSENVRSRRGLGVKLESVA